MYATNTNSKVLIGESIDFVWKQSNSFIHLYINTFIQDCFHAYEGSEGMSCVKGILERFFLLVGDTAYIMLQEDPENKTYANLAKFFGKQSIDINDFTQEWSNQFLESDELKDMTKKARKQHYIDFVKRKYIEQGHTDRGTIDHIIKAADKIDYVFDTLEFGGKAKKRVTKKQRKNRRRKTKRTRK